MSHKKLVKKRGLVFTLKRIVQPQMRRGVAGGTHRRPVGGNFSQAPAPDPPDSASAERRKHPLKIPLARNSQLNKHRRDGRQNRSDNRQNRENVSPAVAVAPAAEIKRTQKHIGNDGNKAGHHHDRRGKQHVAIADMRKFVRDYPLKLRAIKPLQKAVRHRDDGAFGTLPVAKALGDFSRTR